MKKLLFIVLTLFICTNNVKAAVPTTEDVLTCSNTTNLWDSSLNYGWLTASVGNQLTFQDNASTYYAYGLKYVAVTAGETYTFSFWNQSPTTPGEINLYYVDSNFNYVSKYQVTSSSYGYHNSSFVVPDGVSYLIVYVGYSAKVPSIIDGIGTNIMFQISAGSVSLSSTDDYTTYEACPVVEPDPEVPEEDNTEDTTSTIDYTIFYVIAVLICTIFLYKFLNSFFNGKR